MKEYKIDQIRNLALCGHNSCGKTTLAEAILHITGTSKRFGKVEEGTSVSDFSDEEISRKISISATLLHADHKGTKFNVIDLPGFPDLFGETVATLPAVDVAVVVVSATAGVEVVTEQVVKYCDAGDLPRAFVINKLDKEHVEFQSVVDKIQNAFGSAAVPVQLPIGEALTFKGVVNLVSQKAFTYDDSGKATSIDIPDDMKDAVAAAREKLIENVAESDDQLLEKFFESGELSDDEIQNGMKNAIKNRTIVPIFVTAASNCTGVNAFLNFASDFFPTPADTKEFKGLEPGTTDEKIRLIAEDGTPTAYIFKTVSEAHVGELSFIRMLSGKLSHGTDVYNVDTSTSEKIGQIYVTNGKERSEVDSVGVGDMAALVKLRNTHTGNILTLKTDQIAMPPLDYPSPVVDLGIQPLEKGDEEKISSGLTRLREEDPTFSMVADPELKQTLILAQGELQVDILVKKLKERFGVGVELVKPKIAYRETLTGKAEVVHRYKKQSGGRGQFGEVHIRVSPRARSEGFEFLNSISGGVIPAKFIPSVEKGVVESMRQGQLSGHQVIDIQVELFYGKTHAVDSSDQAFKMAGLFAFREAFDKCKPVMLEPLYNIEVRIPDEFTGDVAGDISSRRGRIAGMTPDKGQTIIKAQVPLAELYKYSTQLKSLTQGRGLYSREFSHYEDVPRDVQEKLVAEHQQAKEADK